MKANEPVKSILKALFLSLATIWWLITGAILTFLKVEIQLVVDFLSKKTVNNLLLEFIATKL